MRASRVKALLMGGQACVFYGGAEFSRDTDFAILADAANLARLGKALVDLPIADLAQLEIALGDEESRLRTEDKAYWRPLREELERLRHPK